MPSFIVVEDSLTFRYLIKETVRKLGYELIAAVDNIASAIDYMKAGRVPDVVMIDVVLPGEPGTKLIEYCRANHPQTKIVLTSGLNSDQLIKMVPQGGYDARIQKPFNADQLSACINGMLNAPPAGQPPAGQPMPGQPYPQQPMPGQPYPQQPMPGQPYPQQPMPGQP